MVFAINSFYITVLIIIALCFLYILIFYTMIPLMKNARVKKYLKAYLFNKVYIIKKEKTNNADFVLIYNNISYFIKLIDVKKNSDILINSNKSIVMYYKSITNSLKAKELSEAKEFINCNCKNKIIFFNSNVNELKRAYNENEVRKFNTNESVNDTYIASYLRMEEIIKK